jgi:hypothetical protein
VYLSVDALVNRGSLDLIGALLEANSVLDSLSPDGQKARKARQQAELQAAGAGQFRQITRCVLLGAGLDGTRVWGRAAAAGSSRL